MRQQVILSIIPGIDLLGRAFDEEMPEACIVRGPDLLWGGDVRRFHVPAGVFWGVIGGPPCQAFSRLRLLLQATGHDVRHGNMIPEFERVVDEAQPAWFVMENVPDAPTPEIADYIVRDIELDNRWVGGEQRRRRRFSFGTRDGRSLQVEVVALEALASAPTVLAGHGPVGRGNGYDSNPTIEEMCQLQGLPPDFLADAPFTAHGKRKVIGNGVPLRLGRAIARAVKRALEVPHA